MAKSKPSFAPSTRAVTLQIAELAARVNALVKSQQSHESQANSESTAPAPDDAILKPILSDLYESMTRIEFSITGSTAKVIILKAWLALLAPIQSLSALEPHGAFLAARMFLYFMHGFMKSDHSLRAFENTKQVAECAALLLRLDDTLLGYLKAVWKRSRAREEA